MDYLNVLVPSLRAPPFLGASPHEMGVWVRVMAYCCGQENGGRIDGAAAWTSEMLMFSLGVSSADLKKCGRLVMVDGNDIVAVGYPDKSQESLNKKRMWSAEANRKRWERERRKSGTDSEKDSGTESGVESERERERERERETPPNPHGGLSEGKLKFVPITNALLHSGKFAEAVTPAAVAVWWRNHALQPDPTDPGLIEFVRTNAATAASPRIGSPGAWLRAQVESWQAGQKGAQKRSAALNMGPPLGVA